VGNPVSLALIYWGRGVLIEDEQERGEKLEVGGRRRNDKSERLRLRLRLRGWRREGKCHMSKLKCQMTNA
jgi:hypothetical protein